MKKLLVFAIALTLLIPFARTTFAASSTTAKSTVQRTRLPFKGTMESTETYAVDFPTMSVTASGSGTGTPLGQFTVKYGAEVNLLDFSWDESTELIGFNGDSIRMKGLGQATQNKTPTLFNVVEIYTITGGTGRFSGASGTLTLNRLFSIATGATSGTFEGYVFTP